MYEAYLGEVAGRVPGRAGDLTRSVSRMLRSLEGAQSRLREHAQALTARGDKEGAAACRKLSRKLGRDIDRLRAQLDALDMQKEAREEAAAEGAGVDYGKYRVDRSVPHTIAEDLESRRPAGYRLFGDYREVRTWKQVLIEVCGELNHLDPMLFSSLEGDPDLMGRVRPRISSDPNRLLDPSRVPDARMYVETHLSAGLLCRILRTLLMKFEIPETQLRLYLDKDYTPLRRERQALRRTAENHRQGQETDSQIEGQMSLSFTE